MRQGHPRAATPAAATLASAIPARYAQPPNAIAKVAAALIRRLFWPGLSASLMFLLLIGLGTWQIQRLHWKRGILAQIAHAEAAPPVPLAGQPSPFTKVAVTGRLRADLSAWYGAEVRDTRRGRQMGAYLIQPLERPDAPPLLVNRGWVPQERAAPIDQPTGHGDRHRLRASRRPSPHCSAPPTIPPPAHFYTLDPKAIGAALGLHDVAPFVLVALGPQPPHLWPDPAKHLPRPPNNHLQYALTWYGLAGVLVVMFVLLEPKEVARMTAYDRLTTRFARIATISEASAVLGWDAAAMMPPGGAPARGDQLAVLAGLAHGLLATRELGDDLAEAEADGRGRGSLARRQSGTDAPRLHPRHRHAGPRWWRRRPAPTPPARRSGARPAATATSPSVSRTWPRWCGWCAKPRPAWRRHWA